MTKSMLGTVLAALLVTVTLAPAKADEGDITYRKAIMTSIGGHMKAMVTILKGQVPHKDDMAGHAHAMAELAKIAGHIFPEGSDFGETEAKAEIWSRPDDFKQAVMNFQTAAANLAQVAKGGDMKAVGGAIGGLGKTCKGCHDNFRQKN